MQFRFPKDDQNENKKFYQRNYRQEKVTDLPLVLDIKKHIANNFADVGRDLSLHLKTIREFVPEGAMLLDYGSSWGYCVYQMMQAGYKAIGFEISEPRVEYGREMLGVNLTNNLDSFPNASFDGIYSAHVLEHIPSLMNSFDQMHRLLRPGGHLLIYVPNCVCKGAREMGVKWPQMINEKHVLALTPEFFDKNLTPRGFDVLFTSSPYDQPARPYLNGPYADGEELLTIARKSR